MRKLNWKETAELIGIFSILASLVVVAMQLHQQEELLQLEIRNYLVTSSLELNASIAGHADVWAKGNAGLELDADERVAYETLLVSVNDWYFHSHLVLRQIAPQEEGQIFALYAGFLSENPGAYDLWLERERKLDRYRASLGLLRDDPADDVASDWLEVIQSSVDRIQRPSPD